MWDRNWSVSENASPQLEEGRSTGVTVPVYLACTNMKMGFGSNGVYRHYKIFDPVKLELMYVKQINLLNEDLMIHQFVDFCIYLVKNINR